MADFNSLVSDVFTITNRRDLINETVLAVKSATLQLHRRDFFAKDLLEVILQFNTTDYLQSIDYRTIFPRYRQLKYLRKYDPTGAAYPEYGMGKFLDIVTPEQVLDSYQASRNDIAYVAGSSINLRSSTSIQYVSIGLYLNPIVDTAETYSSWIALEAPYAIVYAAAAIVQGSILRDAQGQAASNRLSEVEMVEVVNSNILNKGD